MNIMKPPISRLTQIKIEDIIPCVNQPRKIFDPYELSRLTESIKSCGIIQPLTVRKTTEGYVLVAGERRLRAAKAAGLKRVPCIIAPLNSENAALISIIENIQRSDLTLFEQAEGISRLISEYSLSFTDAAERLGIAQSTLSNKLRILKLSAPIRERITASRLTERHARALLRLPDSRRESALDKIIAEDLSVKETEQLIENMLTAPSKSPATATGGIKKGTLDIRLFGNSLNRLIGTLNSAGIDARQRRHEGPDFVEYRIRIKKYAPDKTEAVQLKIC